MISPVKLSSGKNWALYALEVDGHRLDRFKLHVERTYVNRKSCGGPKGMFTKAAVVDHDVHSKLFQAKANTSQIDRESNVAVNGSLRGAVAKFEKFASDVGAMFYGAK